MELDKHFDESDPTPGIKTWKRDLLVISMIWLISALLAVIPDLARISNMETFYLRYLPLILFNGLILYTIFQKSGLTLRTLTGYGLILIVLITLVSLLPVTGSDSSVIALIHVPLFLWCLFGLAFMGFDYRNLGKRIRFIRYNGELLIMTGLILITGAILVGMTVGLYEAIGIRIPEAVIRNAVVIGSAAAVLAGALIIKVYPDITARISPVIARLFTPLVLVSVVLYLIAMLFVSERIFKDREMLLLLNFLLLAIVALILFSISELDKARKKDFRVLVLFILACLALLTNAIALAAILDRLTGGLTPNRMIIMIANVLVFIHLLLMSLRLYGCYFKGKEIESVERVAANYLTVYFVYTVFAMFVFPAFFGYR